MNICNNERSLWRDSGRTAAEGRGEETPGTKNEKDGGPPPRKKRLERAAPHPHTALRCSPVSPGTRNQACVYLELQRRYPNLHLPSDLFHLQLSWTKSFPLEHPLPLTGMCRFHVGSNQTESETDVCESTDDAFSVRDGDLSLPEGPSVVLHPSAGLNLSVVSLSSLLEPQTPQTRDSCEVSLMAEVFSEMLQRDFGLELDQCLCRLPHDPSVKEDRSALMTFNKTYKKSLRENSSQRISVIEKMQRMLEQNAMRSVMKQAVKEARLTEITQRSSRGNQLC
ncbi:cell division cycle and apoptosis regulator protein 1-like [Carassius auratus]|uniref:Cell division cycle and apoptosis regulator protein 1-like n=1 Tax=Carassius auratus TaxID=7957 RepID=A0A6P6QD50_CARAU|nr:cell division cycle and apoptosis regulator protein 1-like [Carassius auratus]